VTQREPATRRDVNNAIMTRKGFQRRQRPRQGSSHHTNCDSTRRNARREIAATMSPPSHSSNGSKAFPDQIPRGLRLLQSGHGSLTKTSSSSFGAQLQAEAAAIERWWAQPRWQHTKRIYSGTCVCCTVSEVVDTLERICALRPSEKCASLISLHVYCLRCTRCTRILE
jgi:hypothetical protein